MTDAEAYRRVSEEKRVMAVDDFLSRWDSGWRWTDSDSEREKKDKDLMRKDLEKMLEEAEWRGHEISRYWRRRIDLLMSGIMA